MADKTVTPADVRGWGTPVKLTSGEAGIQPGHYLYADSADGNKLKRGKRTVGAAEAAVKYVALTYADDEDDVSVVGVGAEVEPGFAVTAGEVYVLGTGNGGIEAGSDGLPTSGQYTNVIGVGQSNGRIKLAFSYVSDAHG